MRKCFSVLFLLFTLSFYASGQDTPAGGNAPTSDEQLAAQYFQNKEYDKAAYYYEKLFEKKPIDYYYNNYLFCLLELQDYKKAEKLVKKQVKRNPYAFTYRVDLGYVLKTAGEAASAKKEFEAAISDLTPNQNQVFELANAFIQRKEFNYAMEAYQRGRKLLKGTYTFNFEIADLYAQKGDFTGMVNEYLDVLLISDAYIQQVQNSLLRVYQSSESDKTQVLKTELLRRIQKHPDKNIFAELLIWLFIQEKDFNAALIQARALDKRMKEDGGRVFSLAHMAVSNQHYDAAIKAYQYIIEKGPDNFYYRDAKIEQLEAMNKNITTRGVYTREELLALEKGYIDAIAELGKRNSTAPLLKSLAHLYAFYLHDTGKAVELLEEAITLPGIKPYFVAEAKLMLGDILLLSGETWEAALYYSQVEKAFKHDPVGDEAKLRNARLSYYIGEFKWSQAHLDVLKGSTSKLIANDAMQLSLLISDNSTIDTNTVPLLMFARADLLSFQNKNEEAIAVLDSIDSYFQGHALADEILYKKAKIAEKRQDFKAAAGYLQQLMEAYGYDILADDAIFRLAELQQFHFNDIEKAKELYQKILTDYPGSLFTVEARKRFRELRGDTIN